MSSMDYKLREHRYPNTFFNWCWASLYIIHISIGELFALSVCSRFSWNLILVLKALVLLLLPEIYSIKRFDILQRDSNTISPIKATPITFACPSIFKYSCRKCSPFGFLNINYVSRCNNLQIMTLVLSCLIWYCFWSCPSKSFISNGVFLCK